MDAPEKKKTGATGGGAAKPAASNKGKSAPRKQQTHRKKTQKTLPPTTWERTILRYVTGSSWMSEPNYLFYTGRLQSVPEGDWIDQVHLEWFWNYDLLEAHHGYIQWLFPIFEGQGMNFGSYRLLKEEARKMRSNFACNTRFLHSYKLMLNFYGLRLVNYETGELERTEEYEERFLNLNYCSHNNLRISRILIALGEHGFGRYKPQLLGKLREEIEEHGNMPECKESLAKFWTFLVEGEDTPKYVEKTKESPEDRAEAVFFKHQKAKDRVYQKWEQDEQRWTETLQEARERMRDKLDEARARRMKDFERRADLFADMERDRAKARAQKARQQQQQQPESKPMHGGAKTQRSRKGKEKRGDNESSSEESEPEKNAKDRSPKREEEQKEEENEEEDVKKSKTPKQEDHQESSSSNDDDDDDGKDEDKEDQSKGDDDDEDDEEEDDDEDEEEEESDTD